MRWTRLLAGAALAFALLAPVGAGNAAVAKTAICHFDAEGGVYKLITVADPALRAHLLHHADGRQRGEVPDQPGYVFNDACLPSQVQVVDFDDVVLAPGTETGPLGAYAGFAWTKTWVYRPGVPDAYGYGVSSAPNIGFIGFPQDLNPLVATSQLGDVSFIGLYVTNPSGSATDPDGPLTVTIRALDDGVQVGETSTVLVDGTGAMVALNSATDGQRFESVDTLQIAAGGKYFGIDDLTYHLEP